MSLRVALLVASGILASCREPPVSAGGGTPVISLVLVAGESLQVGTITLAARPDSALPDTAAPVTPSAVALTVTDPAGNRFPVEPASVPGEFVVRLTPNANTEYELMGTMYGVPVRAHTVVPTSFAILSPTSDTIQPSDGRQTLSTLIFPYQFLASGAAGFGYRVVGVNGRVELPVALSSARGEIVVLREPSVRRLALLAYDVAAAGWLGRGTPRSNVAGAFGCFGSALLIRRYVNAP